MYAGWFLFLIFFSLHIFILWGKCVGKKIWKELNLKEKYFKKQTNKQKILKKLTQLNSKFNWVVFELSWVGKFCVLIKMGKLRPTLLIWVWRFECSCRWSDLLNDLSQFSHLYGLSPECFLRCRVSSSFWINK